MEAYPQIHGLVVQKLKTNTDERGFFREVMRDNDEFFQEEFGSLSHSKLSASSTVTDWRVQPDALSWWYVPIGRLLVMLYDARLTSPTATAFFEIVLDSVETNILKVPAGVAYSFEVLEDSTLIFVSSPTSRKPQAVSVGKQ